MQFWALKMTIVHPKSRKSQHFFLMNGKKVARVKATNSIEKYATTFLYKYVSLVLS